jgi:organic radical activating enzyme
MFVRLSGCNLACRWCDTPYTWDWTRHDKETERRRVSPHAVLHQVRQTPVDLVVVTGGEPLLQQRALIPLAQALHEDGRRIEVETNGTIAPHPELAEAVSAFNVSPKLSSAGGLGPRRIRPEALAALTRTGKAVFKFVASSVHDLEEIAALRDAYALGPIWVMPEGTDTSTVLTGMRELAGEVIARGWNLTGRLHVLLWEDERGR